MTQTPVALRPMAVADLIDQAFALCRRHFGYFAKLEVVLLGPATLLQAVLPPLAGAGAGASAQAATQVVMGLAASVAGLMAYAAVTRAVAAARMGQRLSLGEAYMLGGGLLWRLLAAGVLYILAAMLLMITIAGSVYVLVLWSQVLVVLVLERVGVFRAFGRSRALIRGSWWRVCGYELVVLILYLIAAGLVGGVIGGVGGLFIAMAGYNTGSVPFAVVTALANIVGQCVATPFLHCATVLLYYDLRVRKEGLDLELRAEQLAAAAAS